MGAPAQVINNTVHYVEGDASAPGNSNEDKEFSIDALDAEIIRTEERLLRLRGQREAFSKSSGQ